jgi:hypothetical protein
MTDRTSLSLLKRTIPSCSFPENIVLGDIIQNLFNLRVNYPRRFLHVSILLISDCTLRLLKKLVKRKLQEGRGGNVGSRFHLLIFNSKVIWELVIISRSK